MLIPSEQDFAQAVALWREWNGRINVISRKDEDNIFAHHILHSLAIAQYLEIYYPSCVVNPPEVEGFGDQHASACTAEGVSELVRTESPGAAGYVRGGAPDKTCEAVGTVRTDGKQLFVATGDKWLEIKELQLAGKKRMSADAFLRGFREIEACKFV